MEAEGAGPLIPCELMPEPAPVRFEPEIVRDGLILLRTPPDQAYVIRVAAPEQEREEVMEFAEQLRVGVAVVPASAIEALPDEDEGEDGYEDEFRPLIAAMKWLLEREQDAAGVLALEIVATERVGPEQVWVYVIDPPIGNDWVHLYSGGAAARVSIDRDRTPAGRVRVNPPGPGSYVVGGGWKGAALGGVRIRGLHAPSSWYDISGAGSLIRRINPL